MYSRLHDIVNYKSKKIDEIVRNNYSGSFLNNTKWHKLLDHLTNEFDEVYINYKLIYDHIIEGYLFDGADCELYFLEPIKYKEVEWIEFPNEFHYWKNINNLKADKGIFRQDTRAIKSEIEQLGKYRMDEFADKLRLYAHI